jgi:Transposase DDE domain group 1
MVLRHVVKAIRARWPRVEILVRGDSHYGRPEAMTWCEHNRVGYVFGVAGNKVLLAEVAALAEDAAVRRAQGEALKVRRFGEFRYAARSWHALRKVVARVEASTRGSDSRFIVTNLAGAPRWLYDSVYCPRPGREPDQGVQAAPRSRSLGRRVGERGPNPSPAAKPARRRRPTSSGS